MTGSSTSSSMSEKEGGDFSLSDQLADTGPGSFSSQETPEKLIASTPADLEKSYKPRREQVLRILSEALKVNEALSGFCTGEGSVVTLSVRPEDEKHLYTRQYNIPQAMHTDVEATVARWLKEGRIKLAPTGCRFNSPLLPVKKKDDATGKMSKVRLCVDIRKLNRYLLEDDKFQLPRIPDMLATLSGGKLFGEFDLSEAYFQFSVAAESQPYTAFTWNKQQYVFVGCPFGIKHIPSLFQRFISNLFRDMPFVFCYIDNICFSSASWEEHTKHALAIIERLNSVNLKIKPSSVNIGNHQIKLLGHLITPHGIGMDPDKQRMMMEWPLPSSGAGLASFLGLGTYLRDHIRHYADLTAPFEKMKKQAQIQWTDALKQQFETVKRAFATAPFLKFPDFNKRFAVATDASQTGVGGVLYQPDDDDDTITPHNIVAIVSKQLNESQRRYPVYKKELWGLVYCLRKFHTYLHGRRDVHVHVDHKPLIHIFNQTQLSTALQQWLDVILDYDLIIKYRPGVLHVMPDALSRMYTSAYVNEQHVWGTHDNVKILDAFHSHSSPCDFLCEQSINEAKPVKVVKKRHIVDLHTHRSGEGKKEKNESKHTKQSQSHVTQPSIHSLKMVEDKSFILSGEDKVEFLHAHSYAPLFSAAYEPLPLQLSAVMSQDATRPFTEVEESEDRNTRAELEEKRRKSSSSRLTDDEKLLLAQEKRGKKVPDEDTRVKLLDEAHAAGHFGEKAMYTHIERKGYWWPRMRADITSEISRCVACQKHNIIKAGYAPAQSVFAARPSDHYQIDLAQFPVSRDGYHYCLVLVDVFSGFVMLEPITDKEASTVARALWKICCLIGIPRVLQSDNGSEFSNKIINSLCRLTGIPRRFIAPYNPRADGKVERTIKTVKQIVMKLLHGTASLWPLYIPFVQLAYNNKVHELTGSTPFSLMFGRIMNELRDYTKTDTVKLAPYTPVDMQEWKEHQEKVVSLIFPAINEKVKGKQEEMRKKVDQLRKKIVKDELMPGAVVLIKDPTYLLNPSVRPSKEPSYIGPYTVVRRTLHGPYLLRDDTGAIYPRHVPVDQMKIVYTNNIINKTHTQTFSKDEKEDESDVYEVDYIMDHREKNGQFEYHVKWKGYDKSEATWEPEDNINDPQPIERYFTLQNTKSKRQGKNKRRRMH